MPLSRVATVPIVILLAAYGHGDGPSGTVLAQTVQNPCIAALAQAETSDTTRATNPQATKDDGYGADTRDVRDLLLQSSLASTARPLSAQTRQAASQDINDIAVIEDDGTLIVRPNAFDLRGVGLRFEPNGAGYDVAAAGPEFRTALGSPLALGDDDTTSQPIPFPFEFFGRQFTALFVNSDGNLTFDEADNASTARGLSRLIGGPPRVAPFFADLDPSAGGRVFVDAAADAFTITWCAVPGFGLARTMTVQSVLLPEGVVEVRFGSEVSLGEGIVALSPGRSDTFMPVDLTQQGRQGGGGGAVGERFVERPSLDLVQAARRFYETHGDTFDQLVFWTDTPVIADAFAFESTVQNAIEGIGVERFDSSREFGSAGALQSVVNMDRVAKYGDNPTHRIFGENSALAILAHETGHRWLATLLFKDASGGSSDLLLGRQRAHWSFFMDSDASVMEGNDIEDLRGGEFRTVAAAERYSRLDMYAMGLATAAEVPAWFFVDAPISDRNRESAPIVGATVTGTRRDVLIQDVIDVLGERAPAAGDSPRVHRQAFVYVRGSGTTLDQLDLTRLDRLRREWEPFFQNATESRMTVRTTLEP